jgi:Flp pilus assembly protein TadG
MTRRHRNNSKKGHSVVEVALMAPWILLLFLAVFDFGYYMYAGISVANAARAASLEMGRSASYALNQGLACSIVREDLRYLPNATTFDTTCANPPLVVTVGNNGAAMAGLDGQGVNARVRVSYTTIQLFPLPWLLGQATINREADMRVYE